MKKSINHALAAVSAILLLVVMVGSPSDAATSVVHDRSGDVSSSASYMDVVHARVVEQRGQATLLFMMQLAGAIAQQPSEADLIWPFHVDTDRGKLTNGLYNEYVVRVRWFNGVFVGQVVDRTGVTPVASSVPFRIDGRTLKVFVPLDALGDPSSFGWNAATRPGATVPYVDFAPDGGLATDLASWTK